MPLQAKSIKVPMYGLDCEMCITREGMEVTRISMVDAAGKVRLMPAANLTSLSPPIPTSLLHTCF